MEQLKQLFSRACELSERGKKCNVDLNELTAIRDEFCALLQRAEAAEAKLAELEKQEAAAWTSKANLDALKSEAGKNLEFMTRDKSIYSNPVPLFTRPAPAVSLAELNVRRDAIRYRFLRDSDFFGADNEPGLASWDELSELDCNEFDAAVDARINHPDSLYPIILSNIEEAG